MLVGVLSQIGGNTFMVLAVLVILYIGWKFWQRQRLLHELRTARITVGELRRKLDEGEPLMIVDLRSATELQLDPTVISGAIHVEMDQIESYAMPHDRDIIVYCNCPNEISSARVALALQRKGFTRIRPLLGGLAAWREQNYPTEHSPVPAGSATSQKRLL
jgi:rhodanese-related sulfurtransferase